LSYVATGPVLLIRALTLDSVRSSTVDHADGRRGESTMRVSRSPKTRHASAARPIFAHGRARRVSGNNPLAGLSTILVFSTKEKEPKRKGLRLRRFAHRALPREHTRRGILPRSVKNVSWDLCCIPCYPDMLAE